MRASLRGTICYTYLLDQSGLFFLVRVVDKVTNYILVHISASIILIPIFQLINTLTINKNTA